MSEGWRVQGSASRRLRNVGSEWPFTCFRSTHVWCWLMEKSYGAVCHVAAGVLKPHNKRDHTSSQIEKQSLRKLHFFISTTVKLA